MKQVARIIGINGLFVLLGVITLELIFGNWFRPNRMSRLNLVRDATLTYDASGLYGRVEPVVYTRDQYGFRGEYASTSDIDILTVGGSTTDQRYITDGETWQDVLAEEFEKAGKTVTIVNAGVDGQSSFGHIKNFDWWYPFVPGLKVKYFLVYVGHNDNYKDDHYEYDQLVRQDNSLKGRIKNSSVFYYLLRTLRGIQRARRAVNLDRHKIDYAEHEWTDRPLVDDYMSVMESRLEAYRVRLRVLVHKIREAGGEPIFVTQSVGYGRKVDGGVIGITETFNYGGVKINGIDLYLMHKLVDKVTLEVCREAGGICIDSAADIEWEPDETYDLVHTTPKGARRLGRYLYLKLASLF